MNTLVVEHLQKQYRQRHVVKDISLSVRSGEIVGLLGPNGAGKTTSFYMIAGLIAPDRGTILLNDQKITSYAIDERARLGISYLPQEVSIFRKLTVEENILAVLELCELSADEQKNQLEQLLQEFHLLHLRHQLAITLSGGECRRVEIARALARKPKFVLLDEPFAGIDPISVVDIKNIIKHLAARQIGVLISDHNVRETLRICSSAAIVNEGKIICIGSAEIILNDANVRKVYLGEEFIY